MASSPSNLNKPLLIFYLVVIYGFASFGWWCYLLLDKNHQEFEQQKTILELRHEQENKQGSFQDTERYQDIKDEYYSQIYMIIGEGVVFLLILVAGIYKIRSTFFREIELANQQKNFLLSITHELKSPLSSIKLALQTLGRQDLNEENKEKVVANSLQDTERLEDLVNNILLATKIEEGRYTSDFEIIDMSTLVDDVVEKEQRSTERQIETSVYQDLTVKGDRAALRSVITNLVENAIKYSPAEKPISVTLKERDGMAVLSVADQGKGIPDKQKERVFDKFYRLGNEETRSTKGAGLGLFLVKTIARYHDGTAWIRDNEPQGAVVKMMIPVLQQ